MKSKALYVGLSGAERNASVTLCTDERVLAICEQERVSRVRAAGFNPTGVPDEALDELLRRNGYRRQDVAGYAIADSTTTPPDTETTFLEHHFAHACAAFLPSPFESATIVVCDHESPQLTVWDGEGTSITQVDWPWQPPGFAELYSQCAEALGFARGGHEQRMEALARLRPNSYDERIHKLFWLEDDHLGFAPNWEADVETWARRGEGQDRPLVAAALQRRIAELLVAFLTIVRQRAPQRRYLCTGGSLFFNSYLNSRVRLDAGFDDVFVPVNPGNAGLSVGAVLHISQRPRQPVTPFLGPAYNSEEVKSTLDNCKLTYEWASESDAIAIAVKALTMGRLVAWFDGPMEWGPRALGARSILANPFSPYVLDNLNRFLKHREPWRGYALSGLDEAVAKSFDGPATSPFMECDFVPKDGRCFSAILPGTEASIRIQTIGAAAPPRFQALLQAFGAATGRPFLVNTSFNGFQEPIVCSPRDAIRVLYGTGIDLLILGQFVIRK
jgi:carbamoyltransferase